MAFEPLRDLVSIWEHASRKDPDDRYSRGLASCAEQLARTIERMEADTAAEIAAASRNHDDSPRRNHVVVIMHGGRRVDQPETPATATPEPADPFGGHEFAYEPHTDLFRCVRCHAYEVTARDGDTIKPCAGQPPAGAGPIEVNAW